MTNEERLREALEKIAADDWQWKGAGSEERIPGRYARIAREALSLPLQGAGDEVDRKVDRKAVDEIIVEIMTRDYASFLPQRCANFHAAIKALGYAIVKTPPPALSSGVDDGWRQELSEALALATPQNIDTAESVKDDIIDCPTCAGDGSVDRRDYCNYDDAPLGVEFYGIGDAYLNAERLFRALVKAARTLLAAAPHPPRVTITEDQVIGAICCPRGCQFPNKPTTCQTARDSHATQARAVIALINAGRG